MLVELDKVMQMFEQAEKERVDLIKKIQVLQGLELDLNSLPEKAPEEGEQEHDDE